MKRIPLIKFLGKRGIKKDSSQEVTIPLVYPSLILDSLPKRFLRKDIPLIEVDAINLGGARV